MPLQFDTCSTCNEEHALMRNGQMSIHQNASGIRCAGSGDPAADSPEQTRKQKERAAAEKADRKLRGYIAHMMNTGDVDRRIYGTTGGHSVSGGLPGSSRRH